jgi:hypothetical protein
MDSLTFLHSPEYALIEEFYATAPPVPGYDGYKQQIDAFVAKHLKEGRKIALVSVRFPFRAWCCS